jgi:hypothetical protein
MKFRKWAISISAVALGGVGAVLATRGRRRLFSTLPHHGEPVASGEDFGHAWNESMRHELDEIRHAVEELKRAEPHQTANK